MEKQLNTLSRGFFPFLLLLFTLNLPAQVQSGFAHWMNHGFDEPMPEPTRITATQSNTYLRMEMRERTQWLGVYNKMWGVPANTKAYTTVFGYGRKNPGPGNAIVTYPGPTIEAFRDRRVVARWENHLPDNHPMPIDFSLHIAHYSGNTGIPTVTHLHGGHTESASDGLPEAWYTRNWSETGAYHVKKDYRYDNTQESATLWYHDHTLGMTRLNVYAGLAGFYLLRDNHEMGLIANNIIPGGPFEKEIVVQDRMFTPGGQLYLPAEGASEGDCGDGLDFPIPATPEGPVPDPSIVAEFFGDFILVNGMTWPYLDVAPRKYRFRLLNGSDSRFYVFYLDQETGATTYLPTNGTDGTPDGSFLVIGSDDGFLPQAVEETTLLLGPGERADIVIDFSQFAGQNVQLRNSGPDDPFGGAGGHGGAGLSNGSEPNFGATNRIMQFRVGDSYDGMDATVAAGTLLRDEPMTDFYNDPNVPSPSKTRRLVLFEGRDQYCRLRPQLGVYEPNGYLNGSLMWDDPITELPNLNSTEVWDIYNTTADAHPIHLHLVAFQILGRYNIGEEGSGNWVVMNDPDNDDGHEGGSKQYFFATNNSILNVSNSQLSPPGAWETGWKDTGIIGPGQMMRVIANFDRPGRYVWHCHILSHEDHEMMRPFHVVGGPPGLNMAESNTETSVDAANQYRLAQNYPNPFSEQTEIVMNLPQGDRVTVTVMDLNGKVVRQLANGFYDAGQHTLTWDGHSAAGNHLPTGVYICQLKAGDLVQTIRMMKYQ